MKSILKVGYGGEKRIREFELSHEGVLWLFQVKKMHEKSTVNGALKFLSWQLSLFLMFKTRTAGHVSKQTERICFINIFLGVGSFDR